MQLSTLIQDYAIALSILIAVLFYVAGWLELKAFNQPFLAIVTFATGAWALLWLLLSDFPRSVLEKAVLAAVLIAYLAVIFRLFLSSPNSNTDKN